MAYMLAAVSIIAVSCSDDDDDNSGNNGGNKATIELQGVEGSKVTLNTRETYQIVVKLNNAVADPSEFEFTVSNEDFATVDANGLVTILSEVGKTNVTVTYKKDPSVKAVFLVDVLGVYVEGIVLIGEPTQLVNDLGEVLELGQLFEVRPTDATNQKLTFEVTTELTEDDYSIDVVDNEDAVGEYDKYSYNFSATVPGEYTIVAVSDQNAEYKSDPVVITVEARVTSVEVTEAAISVNAEEEVNMADYFSILPINATVQGITYEITEGESLGTFVDGVFTAGTTEGNVVIKAISDDNAEIFETITITVLPIVPATAITLQSAATGHPDIPDKLFLSTSKTAKYSLDTYFSVTPEGAPLVFSSNDESIVTVEGTEVTVVGVGETTITATSKYAPGVSESIYVRVIETPARPIGKITVTGFMMSGPPPGYWEERFTGITSLVSPKTDSGSASTTMGDRMYVRTRDEATGLVQGDYNTSVVKVKPLLLGGAYWDIFTTDGSQIHALLTY